MKKTSPLETLQNQLDNVPTEARNLYANALALREIVARGVAKVLYQVASTAADPGNPTLAHNSMFIYARDGGAKELPAAKLILETVEGSDEFKAAETVLVPILRAIEEQQAAEAARALRIADAQRTLRETEAEAREAALAEAAQTPAVLAARQAVERAAK